MNRRDILLAGVSLVGLAAGNPRYAGYARAGSWQATPGVITNIAGTCNTTPIYFNTPGSFTWTNTLSSACGHAVLRAWGAGSCTRSNPSFGGGFGQQNGVSLTPGQQIAGQVGDGRASAYCATYNSELTNSWACPGITNCGSSTGGAVVVRGTGGRQIAMTNLGGTVANGGSYGSNAAATGGGTNMGGGGAGGGPHGAGGTGMNATPSKGGNGGQGDNGFGGLGGTGGNSGTIGAPGTDGISLGGTGLESGGAGAGGSSHGGTFHGGAGGQVGGAAGGSFFPAIDGGDGQVAIIPGP